MPILKPLQEAKLDPVYHDALVEQNRAYNALPQVQQRAQEYRRGPVGYPIRVVNDAIRSVRARMRLLFFHPSQNILKGYDPTSAGWKRALQGMAPPQFKDEWCMLTQFLADSVASVRRRDTQWAQEKYAGAEGCGLNLLSSSAF